MSFLNQFSRFGSKPWLIATCTTETCFSSYEKECLLFNLTPGTWMYSVFMWQ